MDKNQETYRWHAEVLLLRSVPDHLLGSQVSVRRSSTIRRLETAQYDEREEEHNHHNNASQFSAVRSPASTFKTPGPSFRHIHGDEVLAELVFVALAKFSPKF